MENQPELTAKTLASTFMKRVTQGLYSIESDKQIDALQIYDWLQKEWSKNYKIVHQWKLLMYDEKEKILTRVLHILSTTQDIQLQLEVVKALMFLAKDNNITGIMMKAGGMSLIISLLLSSDESVFSESLALMKRLVHSGNYSDERTLMINCGLIDVLCLVFINCQNTETLEKIADFWFDFFHCFDRYEKVPEREVSQVCFVLNFMLHQKEGVLADESIQGVCLRKAHRHDCNGYWASFVKSGLIVTLTEILVCNNRPKRELREQALIILCYMASEEPAAKQMVEGGILEEICSHNPEEVVQKEVNLMANMSISCNEIKNQCIRGGVVDFVLKLLDNLDKSEKFERSLLGFLGSIFHPNPKDIPTEYSKHILPVLVKALKSEHQYIVRKSLTGLVCMTATYDGDQFENVDRLMDCSVLPQIVEMIGSSQTSLNATALLLASNLAYSGRKAVVKTLVDSGVVANACSALNRAASYHMDHYSVEVAKLVMWITIAGSKIDVAGEKTRSLGVLIKKMYKERRTKKKKEKGEIMLQTYSEEDLINFGIHILDTIDINEMRALLDMNHFGIFLFSHPEESDPLREKRLKFLVKMVDTIHQLGYQRMYCFYDYHLNEMLEMTTSEETKSVLPYVLSGVCSCPRDEVLISPSATDFKET